MQIHLKLSWIYAPASPGSQAPVIVPPPQPALEALHRLARLGDIAALRAEIQYLNSSDPTLIPFGAKLSEPIESFQLHEVLKTIELYLEH